MGKAASKYVVEIPPRMSQSVLSDADTPHEQVQLTEDPTSTSSKIVNVDMPGKPRDLENGDQTTKVQNSTKHHFDHWKLHCGHPDKYGCDEENRVFYFENTTTIMRQNQKKQYYFEVEILDHWGLNNSARYDEGAEAPHTQFFGFVTKEFEQKPTVSKDSSLATSKHAWCVGRHHDYKFNLRLFHDVVLATSRYNGQIQNPYIEWGSTSVLNARYESWQVGDVFQCYFDKKEGEIWFGMNGEWRHRKGKAFIGLKGKKLFPAICFNNGTLRVNTKEKDLLYKPPSNLDRKSVGTKLEVIIPAFEPYVKAEDDEAELEDKIVPEDVKESSEAKALEDDENELEDKVIPEDVKESGEANTPEHEDTFDEFEETAEVTEEEVEAKEVDADEKKPQEDAREEEEKIVGEFNFDATPDENIWGIKFWIPPHHTAKHTQDHERQEGVIIVSKVDPEKKAWAAGIRRNMMVTRVDGRDVTMDNCLELIKRLDFKKGNPEDVEIHFQNELPIGEPVRIYRTAWNPRTSIPIQREIHVGSLVTGYLHPDDKVNVILQEEWTDSADKEDPKHCIRGLIGEKSEEPRIVYVGLSDIVIKDKPFGDDTRHRLGYFESAVYDPEKTKVITRGTITFTWYCLTEPAGWIQVMDNPRNELSELLLKVYGGDDAAKKEKIVLDWDIKGWITLHDYRSNLSFVKESKGPVDVSKWKADAFYRYRGDFHMIDSGQYVNTPSKWLFIFKDKYLRDRIRALRKNEKLEIQHMEFTTDFFEHEFQPHYNFKPGWYKVRPGRFITIYEDTKMQLTKGSMSKGEVFKVTKIIKEKSPEGTMNIMGELENRCFIQMHTDGHIKGSGIGVRPMPTASWYNHMAVSARLSNGFWITMKESYINNNFRFYTSLDRRMRELGKFKEDDMKTLTITIPAKDDIEFDMSAPSEIEDGESDEDGEGGGDTNECNGKDADASNSDQNKEAADGKNPDGDDDKNAEGDGDKHVDDDESKAVSLVCIVEGVEEGSQAYKDGLRQGQCVLKVNGIDLRSMKKSDARKAVYKTLSSFSKKTAVDETVSITVGWLKKPLEIKCPIEKWKVRGRDEPYKEGDTVKLLNIRMDGEHINATTEDGIVCVSDISFELMCEDYKTAESSKMWSEELQYANEGIQSAVYGFLMRELTVDSGYDLFDAKNCQGFVHANEIVHISEFKRLEGERYGGHEGMVVGKTKRGWLMVQSPSSAITEGYISPCPEALHREKNSNY